jgi:DNA-binding XRE family transcriptional regulator
MSIGRVTDPVALTKKLVEYVTGMVTKRHVPRRLYLREHRKAKTVTAPGMAELLGIERESVLRMEREWDRCTPTKQQEWADALGIDVEDLWWPPGQRPLGELDAIVQGQDEATRELARDLLTRLVRGR